ncbi:RidA family protein [uncultured Subdoligranulum sp.]|uniref:RidA family protein n=1 Tax=uncultured Subdoligranulum sp. TaxID=512298 RepID=UPI0025FD7E87|nr:RidA family protein [uncultured Subdoligranulum sp.]
MDIYTRLNELGYELPAPAPKGGIYKPVKQVGSLLYVSGQGATEKGVPVICGKVGAERTIEEGQAAARLCTLNALSALHAYLGDLNRIRSVVKLLAFVASAPGFNAQPKVADGASRLLADLWGEEDGVGARSAIATNELPGNITCEIEFIFELKDEART